MAANISTDAAAESSPPQSLESTKPDVLTIAAITVVASVIANFIHEGLGHGGMCIATGGQPLALSTVHFECIPESRLVAAGGTLANLIFGALFWGAARAVRQSATWRYFFWLLMTFNLLEAGGYFLFSGIGNIGDWTAVVAGWRDGGQRGRGAWAWPRSEQLAISFCLCPSACVNCARSWGRIRRPVCAARANSRSCPTSPPGSFPAPQAR